MQLKRISLAAALGMAPGLLYGQFDFPVDGKAVQIHSFASQGFLYSNQNNYLTLPTTQGSFAFTDLGVNVSTQLTDKFRIGAQMYLRNVGALGNYEPQLDWATADYRFKDWFGIRAGKVKTMMGLYNDTQDMDSLHTWALLPQAIYALDLRSRNLSHIGGDIYGNVHLGRAGSLSYTAYAGTRSDDATDGFHYAAVSQNYPIVKFSGRIWGTDLRWTTPINGLMLGGTYAPIVEDTTYIGQVQDKTVNKWTAAGYSEYSRGKWRFDAEYRRNFESDVLVYATTNTISPTAWSDTGWFVSAAFRINKRLEIGTYHDRYYVQFPASSPEVSTHHIYDQAVTARFDLTRFWSVKVEGHFMNGTGDVWSSRGFYNNDNPDGLQPSTNLLVLRTGVAF
jgi:hypothetical protein